MIADNALKVSVRRVWRYESPTTGQDDKECVDAVSTIAQDAAIADLETRGQFQDCSELRTLGPASERIFFLEDVTRS